MLINQRVRELREFLNLERAAFGEECDIKKKTIENIENKIQKINGEHIEKIIERWPEYAYWLTTGKTIPEAGQISPQLEDQRQKLDKAG